MSEVSNEIIKLEYCPKEIITCDNQRKIMNRHLHLARQYFDNKEFYLGIRSLTDAYDATFNSNKQPCKKCETFFRDIIINSCENKVDELRRYTTGVFKRRKFMLDYEFAKQTLERLKSENK